MEQLLYENKDKVCSDYVKHDTQLEVIKCKGVSYSARNTLNFKTYLNTLSTNAIHRVSFNKLASKNHTIHQISQKKVALTSFDDKRKILQCCIHSKPYGHHNTSEICEICTK